MLVDQVEEEEGAAAIGCAGGVWRQAEGQQVVEKLDCLCAFGGVANDALLPSCASPPSGDLILQTAYVTCPAHELPIRRQLP
jgi:hypothetical protein